MLFTPPVGGFHVLDDCRMIEALIGSSVTILCGQ